MAGGTYWWGTFGPKVKGIVTYSLSPFEQKAFHGFFSHGFPNLYKRFMGQASLLVPLGLTAFGIYTWAKHDHDRRLHKDVKHYEKLAEEASQEHS